MKRLETIKDNIEKKEIEYFLNFQRKLQMYIQKLKEDDESITVKNVREKIHSEIYSAYMFANQYKDYKVLPSGKNDLFFLYTIQYILENPKIISTIYNSISKKDKKLLIGDFSHKEYGENLEVNIFYIMNECITVQEDIYKDKIENLSKEDIDNITGQICLLAKKMIKEEKCEDVIKKGYIKRLARMINFLDKFGELERCNELNNDRLGRMGLQKELGFTYSEEGKNDYKITNVIDLKNEKSLEKLSLNELTVLISFYLNRLEKLTESIEKTVFIIEKRNLFGRFFKGEDISKKISNGNIVLHLTQYKYLTEYGERLIKRYIDDSDYFNKSGKTSVIYSLSDILKYMEEQEEKEYSFFSRQNDNSLRVKLKKDVEDMQDLITLRHNLYVYKDRFMEIMMYHLLMNSKDINWGYVEEKSRLNNGRNSIQNGSINVLIQADIRGFNNPIMLHYNLDRLRVFMRNFNGSKSIPVYQGEDDFSIRGNGNSRVYMSNFLLMPLQNSKSKKFLKKAKEFSENSAYYKYIKHLAWISSPKSIPEHLLKNGELRKQEVDLDTGEIKDVIMKEANGR